MSKLYDQLKNAAFARRAALERRSKSRTPSRKVEAAPRSLSEQKVVDDGQWREQIENKLHEADRSLESSASPPPLEPVETLRERELTLAKLEDASRMQAELEAQGFERAREREQVERALHARSLALTDAEMRAHDAARAREEAENAAATMAERRAAQE